MYYFHWMFKFLFKSDKSQAQWVKEDVPSHAERKFYQQMETLWFSTWLSFWRGRKEDIGKVENFLIADTFLQEQIDVHLQRNEPNGQQ